MNNDNLITTTSAASFEAVCERLPDVCQQHAFSVLGMHDLHEKLVSKGQDFPRQCRVFEVCNPVQAHKVLSEAIEVSTALPCRIAVWEEGGRTVLSTIDPKAFLSMFDAPGAGQVAVEVGQTLTEILRDCAAS